MRASLFSGVVVSFLSVFLSSTTVAGFFDSVDLSDEFLEISSKRDFLTGAWFGAKVEPSALCWMWAGVLLGAKVRPSTCYWFEAGACLGSYVGRLTILWFWTGACLL